MYWRFPWATSGDKATIPSTTQPDGSVSYPEGFGVDYQLDPDSDPDALEIPRDKTNELYFQITTTLQQYQQFGAPDFIAAADNGGVAFSYSSGAITRKDGVVYSSLVDSNTDVPPSANWVAVQYNIQSFSTADVMESFSASLPSGWLWLDGKTIGNASSGGTARANADTSALFTELWNACPNAALPIQDSAGAASTRGVSAAADFAANKRLPLPDKRGRVGAGADNLGGTAANRLTANTAQGVDGSILANGGGEQSHTLILAEIPAHGHDSGSLSNSAVGNHTHTYTAGFTNFANNTGIILNTQTNPPQQTTQQTDAAGAHNHTISGTTANAGSSGTHNNVQPTLIANYRIKL